VFFFISFFHLLRICSLSVFKKFRQKSYLIQKILVFSISEWSHIWQIHKLLVGTRGKPDEKVKTCRQDDQGINMKQPPPHPADKSYPKPKGHWDAVFDALRGGVDSLFVEYKASRA